MYTLPVNLRVFEDVQFYLLWVGVCQQGYRGAVYRASCSVLLLEDKQNLQLIKQSFTHSDINQDQFTSGHCEAGGDTDFRYNRTFYVWRSSFRYTVYACHSIQ